MGLQIEIGGITNLLVRRVVREASKKTLDGAVVVRFIAQADKEILALIREVVEGAKLPKFQHNHEIMVGTKEWHHKEGYNLGAQAQLQAILKAIEEN